MLLVGFEAEEEAPGVFLRLRKAHRKHGQRTFSLATHATRGLAKAGGTLLPAAPGTETEWLDALAGRRRPGRATASEAAEALRAEGAVIVVGERLAAVPGGLTAAVRRRHRHRRPAGVDPAPGRRARRHRGGRAALAAARRPSGHRPAGPRGGRRGLGRRRTARTATAATPARSSRPRPPANCGALLVGGVEVADLPDPARAVRRWTRSASSSAWSCGPARSPSGPTWSCRSPPSPRRPAPSSTGKAGRGCSRPRSSPTR